MLANFHMHTTFSDGQNTPEEIVKYAIANGLQALGFSDHGFMDFDQRYCMKDTEGYIKEIKRLKEKYADKIQVYLGVEEDAGDPVNREEFDYIISSYHNVPYQGKQYPFDSNYEYFTTCLEFYNNDDLAFAKAYYDYFLEYLIKRKPDVIGHFDLITKFDEKKKERYLGNERYWELAESYLKEALKTGSIFEVNTGLITRGFRSTPCPHERLLKIIAENGGKVALSSDAHKAEHICAHFEETKKLLKKVGFDGSYVLYDGKWQKTDL